MTPSLPTSCPSCLVGGIKKNGFYTRHRNRRRIQRYCCVKCGFTFSDQSLAITYRQKRPDLLEEVMKHTSNGYGVRRIASVLGVTVTTIQRKISFLAVVCESFHESHMAQWKVRPRFQFDEAWSAEHGRGDTLTIPTVVETRSYFIVSVRAAHTYSLMSIPYFREENNRRRWNKIVKRDKIIRATLNQCNRMKPKGHIDMETDKKTGYPTLLGVVFGGRLRHTPRNAQVPAEAKKLFPINSTMACMRAEISKLRRDTWHLTKDTNWLNRHLAIYTAYYNYFRKKRYTKTRAVYWYYDPARKNLVPKVKKTFIRETPAMRLKIFDRPIGFEYMLENCGIIPAQNRLGQAGSPQPVKLLPLNVSKCA